MERFINPFSDYGFKRIFGQELNKDLLIDFLNSLLPDRHITNLTFLNSEALGETNFARNCVFDIFCENNTGEKFVVEIQQRRQEYFKDRALFYASFPIRMQAPKGAWDYRLAPVYVVCLLNFKMENSSYPDKYRWDVVLMEKEIKEVFYPKLNFLFLEMPKFTLPVEECDTDYKKWLYVLNNIHMLDRLPPKFNNQVFRKLKEITDVEQLSPQERKEYYASWKAYNDYANTLEYAKNEGKAEGLKEGIEQGLKKGLKEGIEKGEQKARLGIAATLKRQGVDTTLIVQATGLSPEEINRL
ncbi:MAG: Rpn family recombination-promoting nuclease/putative transposase [Parabacteroides sp.]|nr:Rpn family recombination-promoting nuclease/putative transposase [Parabacteroides sp.]